MASELIFNDFLSWKCFEFFANEKKKKEFNPKLLLLHAW